MELRSLDALRMVAALRLGPALGTMISYDEWVLDAAKRHDIAVCASWLDTHATQLNEASVHLAELL